MQGVIITGFAFWSVFRDEDGPFRCYKYMEGGDANSNVQAMCESVLRNLIANSSLDEVLNPTPAPKSDTRLAPTLDVMITIVFVKLIFLPNESVK